MANESKRFTPKKSDLPPRDGSTSKGEATRESATAAASTGRYTPRTPRAAVAAEAPESPAWVAWLMFALFGIGLIIIVLNYTNIAWDTNNWALVAGLVSIVLGFLTATRLR
jgi:hypothetical protein